MATQHAIDEADIRRRIDKLAEAIRAMDLEGAMSNYSPDLLSFDIVPPLQHVGAEAKRKNWVDAFAIYRRPLGYEIRDLTLPWEVTWHSGTASIGSAARLRTGTGAVSGFARHSAFGRSTATGSLCTTMPRCLWIWRAAERC